MAHQILIDYKTREREALITLAKEMVAAAEQRNRPLSPGEDGIVLELLRKARVLEQEIDHLQRDRQRLNPKPHVSDKGT